MINLANVEDNFYKKTPRDLGLYLHIPFCVKKCNYCDFLSSPAKEDIKKQYTEALITEIESYSKRMEDYVVPTIFFGGGTPSCIEADDIRRIMEAIRKVFHLDQNRLEASIEVNPGTLTREKLRIYREAGLNRLSFGLQSVNDKELKLLGRIHTYDQFLENYRLAREEGFTNINIDLMSALPGQTLETWENTLNKVIMLNPEHISAYSLIVEEGTQFYEHYREGKDGYSELPDEDTDRQIYHRTKELLILHGYERYEISNYAKSGYSCVHNGTYWNGTEYLGLGLGASSLLNGARISNTKDFEKYIQLCEEFKVNKLQKNRNDLVGINNRRIQNDPIGIVGEYELLTIQQRIEEFMFLGLRMCHGISAKEFIQRFGVTIDSIYDDELQRLVKQKLLIIDGDTIYLTDLGIDVSNSVLSRFILD